MRWTSIIPTAVIVILILGTCCSVWAQCYDIPVVYDSIGTLLDDTICISAEFTDPYDSMLVHFYYDWTYEEPMPPHSKAKITGIIPGTEAECGGYLELQVVVGLNDTLDGGNPLLILEVLDYTLILPGHCGVSTLYRSLDYEEALVVPCDSCKFAIIVSGGEKNRHWKKLLMMYRHKVANGYCPENIHALYGFSGTSREPDSLASDKLDPCDPNNIRQAHEEIARKVAACHRAGKPAKVQKLFDEHGDTDGSIWIWNNTEYSRTDLMPETLLVYQQMIIDSSNDSTGLTIIDEFVECYGGSTATVLRRGLKPKGGTVIRGNSNAGTSVTAKASDSAPWDIYLGAKLDSLAAGHSYDDAVREAQEAYRAWLIDQIPRKHNLLLWYRAIIACMDGAAPVCSAVYAGDGNWYKQNNNAANKAKMIAKRDSLVADSTKEMTHAGKSGLIFKKQKFSTYCETLIVNVPPGDQIVIEFPDSVSNRMNCGNITVWEDTASSPPPSKWVRRKIWNWNNPGSDGYRTGNNRRVITTPTGGTGRYKIHNDDRWGGFTIGVEARQESLFANTMGNVMEYANVSFGWINGAMDEFNPLLISEYWYCDNAGLEGFDLFTMPGYICPRGGGVGELGVFMGDMGDNIFWRDMELWFVILDVMIPGPLEITVEGAEFPIHLLDIFEPGIYSVHLGDMSFGGRATTIAPFVSFYSDITMGPSFAWDSWALRTIYDISVGVEENRVKTVPQRFSIQSNYPDPFNAKTEISFELPETAQVRMEILDVSGRIVAVPLSGGLYEAGKHSRTIDMTRQSSGVYFLKISTDKYSATEKMILVK